MPSGYPPHGDLPQAARTLESRRPPIVLDGAAFRELDGVTLRVRGDLLVHGLPEVNIEHVGQTNEVDQDVGELLRGGRDIGSRQGARTSSVVFHWKTSSSSPASAARAMARFFG